MKKKDIVLILMILAVAAAFYLWNRGKEKQGGDVVIVEVDGAEYGTYDLNEDARIDIHSKNGYNELVIKRGKAHMEQADCPDKYCVDKGEIYQNGETIICLPHRVVVEVKTSERASMETTESLSIDAMAQ